MHIGSEIQYYSTYYLATVTSHVGILVTMSVHQSSVDKFTGEFTDMMSSLRTYQR